jgi:Protein of unknown function (DUF3604)
VNHYLSGGFRARLAISALGIAFAAAVVLSGCEKRSESSAAVPPPAANDVKAEASAPRENPLNDAYFGEQHIHTAYSLDAYIGGTRLTPFEAYQFAQGAEVEVNGIKHKLDRPLDWVAITDHAEYIGEMYSTFTEGAPGHDVDLVKQLRGLTDLKERQQWFMKYVAGNNRGAHPEHPDFYQGPETTRSAWKDVMVAAAEKNNHPGKFTAFIAFEWTAAPGGANLHRNVIFRDSHVPDLPMSAYEIPREDGLWDWLAGLEKEGMKPLAIPHNPNASKTIMFGAVADSNGKPYDEAYAKRRQHFEPLVEIMQIKGSSEVTHQFWNADEFSDFENAPSIAKFSGRVQDQRNYVRWAVIEGLAWEQKLGTNPFKLGFVGGTDDHNGLTAETMEAGSYGKGWQGAHGAEDGSAERRRTADVGGWIDGKDENPGALTGVWAPANTRAALWDAMARRETFATSGTRIKVRLFGGTGLSADTRDAAALVKDGYDKGVPMGGTLQALTSPPHFNVYAMKDPDGANLDRIQIIKGWVDDKGEHHEKIVNVAWSGDRKVDAMGKLPAVGNTVDLKTAKYENSIGGAELSGAWTDSEFDPKQHALYYARVLEIPTPRWTTYEAVLNGLPLLKDVPATIQERAWSSPIWYTP